MYGIHPYSFNGKKKTTGFYFKVLPPYLLSRLFRLAKIFKYVREHTELIKVLKPFRQYPLIRKRTSLIYLFSYLSDKLSTKNKIQILTTHYLFLQEMFSSSGLKQLFEDGIECWSETINDEKLCIKLTHSSYLEFEGSLSLTLTLNGRWIYKLSFTIAPGIHFNVVEDKIIYISALQGKVGELNAISAVTKSINDLVPSTILMSVLEGIALSTGVKKIIGINYSPPPNIYTRPIWITWL